MKLKLKYKDSEGGFNCKMGYEIGVRLVTRSDVRFRIRSMLRSVVRCALRLVEVHRLIEQCVIRRRSK